MKPLMRILLNISIFWSLLIPLSLAIDEDYYNLLKSAINEVDIELHTNNNVQETKMGLSFPCELFKELSPERDITVHTLTPYDIKVVGAIGDSVTAAFGAKAKNLIDLFTESRGVSWSIGGDETLDTVTTLPNIIKMYNPDLKGFSVGKGNENSENAKFNVAVSGAKARGMLDQAVELVKRMTDENVENEWKVVTLWIGGNDLCQESCDSSYSEKEYLDGIEAALDYFSRNLPKTFVNLVQIIDVTKLNQLRTGLQCLLVPVVCPCAKESVTREFSKKYQEGLEELIKSKEYDEDDFAVVIQPFFEKTELPVTSDNKFDLSYFAPDCFHFSAKAHAGIAEALWDNMVQPVGEKYTNWTVGRELLCPTKERPYFYTNRNSNPTLFSTSQLANNIQLDDNKSGSNHYGGIMIGSIIGSISCSVVVVIIVAIVIVRFKNKNMDPEKAVLLNKN